MKIVFVTIPMTNEPEAVHYNVDGNKKIEYKGKVRFAINSVLAKTMQKGERVKIVCIMNDSGETEKYKNYFKNDLDQINKKIGAKIEYVETIEKFSEDSTTLHNRFKQCIAMLENDAEIIADITFGQRTMVPIIFSVLTFAEKFFNAKIKYVVYGKVEFYTKAEQEKFNVRIKPETAMLYDITSLYYLNNLTASMKATSGEKAVHLIEKFFTL